MKRIVVFHHPNTFSHGITLGNTHNKTGLFLTIIAHAVVTNI